MARVQGYIPPPFVAARGLTDPHRQTIFAALRRPTHRPPILRERWETPDSDFVDVDLVQASPSAPHVIVLHGLEGSSEAGYVAAVLREAHKLGWGALALNFRSCSGEPNRLPRSYHSGETTDVLHVIGILRGRITGPIVGVGFSLGANVLLRMLEETGASAPIEAAAAVSTPFELGLCATALDTARGFGSIYRIRFLRTLKAKALAKARLHPSLLDVKRIRAASNLREFDDVVTAPLHGFASADDYYERCSSGRALDAIRRPTLLLSAKDDPLIPEASLPKVAEDNPYLTLVVTEQGGHVGFVSGSILRPKYWAEEQVVRYLAAALRK